MTWRAGLQWTGKILLVLLIAYLTYGWVLGFLRKWECRRTPGMWLHDDARAYDSIRVAWVICALLLWGLLR